MSDTRKIKQELLGISTLKVLAESFEQISVTRMRHVRGRVLATREFLDNLSKVYLQVKGNYKREIEKFEKKGKKGVVSFTTLVKNGKEVSVLITANNKLYGDIVKKVFRLFVEQIKDTKDDIVVIGRVGKDLLQEAKITKNFSYVEVSDRDITKDELRALMKLTINYEKINVYYGQFENMMSQLAVRKNISGDSLTPEEEELERTHFFFEPKLEDIFVLFENQVYASLLKQAVQEAELARHASRLQQMEKALSNIGRESARLQKLHKQAFHLVENNMQMQRMRGYLLWKK